MIQWLIWSDLAFWDPSQGEVPPTTDWAAELVASCLGLLLLRSTSECGEASRALFSPKKCRCRALPQLLIWNGSNLGDWASPKSAETVWVGAVENPANRVVPLQVVLLPGTIKSRLCRNRVELEIAGVVDPTRLSDVHLLIGVLRGTSICSKEGADGNFGTGLDAVFGFVAGLVAFWGFRAGLAGASVGVVVALRVTRLRKHEMSLCIVRTSSSLSFMSCVSPRRSQ